MTDKKPDMRDSHRTEATKAAEKEVGDAPFARAGKSSDGASPSVSAQSPAPEALGPTDRE